MKSFLGIIGVLIVLVLAFLGLNFLWGWVDIDFKILGKSGLTLLIAALTLTMLAVIWYVFLRPSSYRTPSGNSRAGMKKDS